MTTHEAIKVLQNHISENDTLSKEEREAFDFLVSTEQSKNAWRNRDPNDYLDRPSSYIVTSIMIENDLLTNDIASIMSLASPDCIRTKINRGSFSIEDLLRLLLYIDSDLLTEEAKKKAKYVVSIYDRAKELKNEHK